MIRALWPILQIISNDRELPGRPWPDLRNLLQVWLLETVLTKCAKRANKIQEWELLCGDSPFHTPDFWFHDCRVECRGSWALQTHDSRAVFEDGDSRRVLVPRGIRGAGDQHLFGEICAQVRRVERGPFHFKPTVLISLLRKIIDFKYCNIWNVAKKRRSLKFYVYPSYNVLMFTQVNICNLKSQVSIMNTLNTKLC